MTGCYGQDSRLDEFSRFLLPLRFDDNIPQILDPSLL